MSHDDGGPPSDDAADASVPRDVVLAIGPTADGEGASVVRLREGRVEAGEVRAAREGQPILGELVQLRAREEHAALFDVEVLARGPLASRPAPSPPPTISASSTDETPSASSRLRKGPALVNSDAYRTGWDSIFGARRGSKPLPS
jgi:hypothetical protein